MTVNDQGPSGLRLTLLAAIVGVFFLALLSRLWSLQVLAGERYAALAETVQVRTVILEAPRGRILAADGRELVKNRPAPTISADPRQLINTVTGEPRDDEAEVVLDRLSVLLDMSRTDIIQRLTSRKYSPFRPVPIKEDVPEEIVLAVQEHQELFHGVIAERLPVRTYPEGTLAAHIVGYLGEISEEELAQVEYQDYRQGDLIGWAGLERTYETELRGTEGKRRLRVDSRGTIRDIIEQVDPVRGNDLLTSIDLELQADVERILEDGILASRNIQRRDGRFLPSIAGSAVVLDPRDGSVVAMTSWPSFDPSLFVGGISIPDWEHLQDPENEYPLINRAIQSAYPPGSTFKIISGTAALEGDLISPSSRISCPPAWRLGGITFRNWNTRHEGSLTISDALKRSCDTFFYQLAYTQWQRESDGGSELLPEVASQFGLGQTLGIDLPSERSGVIPGREWRQQFWEEHKEVYCRKAEELEPGTYAQLVNQDLCIDGGRWRGGDAVNRSIGQGDVLTTPLQIATAYASIANGGTVWRPHVAQEIVAPDGTTVRRIEPEPISQLQLGADELAAIQHGLEQVVMDRVFPSGTASVPFAGFPIDQIPVAGKTGTAELKPRVPYAWFASYAPADNPRYVVVVSVEEGGGGSQTAAPIARRILEAAFGLEVSPFEAGPGNTD